MIYSPTCEHMEPNQFLNVLVDYHVLSVNKLKYYFQNVKELHPGSLCCMQYSQYPDDQTQGKYNRIYGYHQTHLSSNSSLLSTFIVFPFTV